MSSLLAVLWFPCWYPVSWLSSLMATSVHLEAWRSTQSSTSLWLRMPGSRLPALRASLPVVVLVLAPWWVGISLCGVQLSLPPPPCCMELQLPVRVPASREYQCRADCSLKEHSWRIELNCFSPTPPPPHPPFGARLEPWALCMLNTCSPTELHSQTIS